MGQNTKIRRQQATAVLACPPAASAGPTSPPRTRIGTSANHNERQSAEYMRRAYAHATHCTRQSANIRPGQGAAIVACPPAAPSGPTSPPRARIHTPAGNDIFEYTPFVQLRCKRIGFASVRDRAHSFYSNVAVQRPIVSP